MRQANEAELAGLLEDALRLYGLRYYHTRDSRRSVAGFPDYTIVLGPVVMFLELKAAGGRVTAEQLDWLEALRGSWRPALVVAGLEGVTTIIDWLGVVAGKIKAGELPPAGLVGTDAVALVGADVKPPRGFFLGVAAAYGPSADPAAETPPLRRRTARRPPLS